jgi:uncharacterized membrane protein
MLAGIALAGISVKLKTNYIYFYYLGIILGLLMFIVGIVIYYRQKNTFK